MIADLGGETDADLFIEAQDSVWNSVVAELTAGRKTSHWMWFVFPQMAHLGHSHMSQLYGIHDLAEAQAYLAHPVLRDRLIQVCSLMLKHQSRSAEEILGPIDAMKLRSSMTLFATVAGAPPVFDQVLGAFFQGEPCAATLSELA